MFENRARKRRKNALLIFVVLLFVSAFGLGYYMNYGGNTNVDKDKEGEVKNVGFKIPGSIRNPGTGNIDVEADPGSIEEQPVTANPNPNNLIGPNTKIIFKTHFTLCSHIVEKDMEDNKELIGLSQEGLKNKYPDWSLNEFSTQQAIFKREIQSYCPRHYIIGVKEGYIAIYQYNDEGVKILYKQTDNPTSILTIEDQSKLEYGIVADSEEELQQKLEGLSD